MLRLWRDRLLISLAPDAVALTHIAGRLRPRLIAKQAFTCNPALGAESWQGAIAALALVLEPLRKNRLDVTVVLSNHFARYAIVPSDEVIATPEENLALARFYFTKIYGEAARHWQMRVSDNGRGKGRLAGAVDTALIEAIRKLFPRKGRLRLTSIQPYLMAAFNQWRTSIGKEDAWFMLVERERTCFALLSGEAWTAVHTSRGAFSSPESWAGLLERQQLRTDATSTPRKVYVHALDPLKAGLQETSGWTFFGLIPAPLEGYLPLEDRPFAMALTSR